LSAADLGLLTSMYFLVFAAVVLPCGALLDRYGPRLIDSGLLLLAAAGSLLFAVADGMPTLLVGRALIGLGVAVGLMAGLKAIVLWFPPERVALANGVYIMLGALGALSATGPAEAVVQALGWRGLFAALAVASAVVALLILLVVPERKPGIPAAGAPRIGLLAIYLDPRFLRIAPLAALGVGASFSLQALWAAPWLGDVAGLDRPAVVEHLTLMAAALAASALLLGAVAERLRRAGIPTEVILAATLALSMTAQLALLLGLPVPSHVLFAVVAAAGAATVLSFAVLAQYFPKEGVGPRQRRPRRPQHGHRLRPAVPLGLHRRPVAGRRRALPGGGPPGRHGRRPRPAAPRPGRVLRTQAPAAAHHYGGRRRQGAWISHGDDCPCFDGQGYRMDAARQAASNVRRRLAPRGLRGHCAVRCPLGAPVLGHGSHGGRPVRCRQRPGARGPFVIERDRDDRRSRCAGGGILRTLPACVRPSSDRRWHARTPCRICARYWRVHCRIGRDSPRSRSDSDRLGIASSPHDAHSDPRRR
jgi:predicted MFS family arabinose efflux permease